MMVMRRAMAKSHLEDVLAILPAEDAKLVLQEDSLVPLRQQHSLNRSTQRGLRRNGDARALARCPRGSARRCSWREQYDSPRLPQRRRRQRSQRRRASERGRRPAAELQRVTGARCGHTREYCDPIRREDGEPQNTRRRNSQGPDEKTEQNSARAAIPHLGWELLRLLRLRHDCDDVNLMHARLTDGADRSQTCGQSPNSCRE